MEYPHFDLKVDVSSPWKYVRGLVHAVTKLSPV